MSRKFFKKFTAEDLFTRYIFELMQERKTFMVFTYNNQILIDDEVDEWNKVHGITNETERLIYHPIEKGYVVHLSSAITSVLTPFEAMENGYKEFIKSVCED